MFPAELANNSLRPILPCTHVHRHARGSDLVAGKHVELSSWTSAYSPLFCAAFGQTWPDALRTHFTGEFSYDFQSADSPFARAPREAFAVPDVLGAFVWLLS